MRELRRFVAEYVERYNYRRLHSSIGYDMPASWCFSGLNAANRPDGHPYVKAA